MYIPNPISIALVQIVSRFFFSWTGSFPRFPSNPDTQLLLPRHSTFIVKISEYMIYFLQHSNIIVVIDFLNYSVASCGDGIQLIMSIGNCSDKHSSSRYEIQMEQSPFVFQMWVSHWLILAKIMIASIFPDKLCNKYWFYSSIYQII